VSRADVANRAGYGMGTIYHHFPDKRDMLLQLIDDWGSTMPVQRRAAFDVLTALSGEPRRAAREFLRKSYEQLRKGPSFYRVIVTEAERDPEVRRRLESTHEAITSWIAELTRLAQQAGMARPECKPEAAAFLLHHLIESTLGELVSRRLDRRLRENVIDELAEMICWYLLGASQDRGSRPPDAARRRS